MMRFRRVLTIHQGEMRMYGGKWARHEGDLVKPDWAKPMKLEELTALERRTHPKNWWGKHFEPVGYSDEDIADQTEKGLRPRRRTWWGLSSRQAP